MVSIRASIVETLFERSMVSLNFTHPRSGFHGGGAGSLRGLMFVSA
jgi:hypothetical protein